MIYLHIGRHKSGTTSLQSFLTNNRAFLEERGFRYASTAPHHLAHHDFARALMRDGVAEDIFYLEAFKEISRSKHHIILSSEGFQNTDPAKLRRFLNGDVRIIVYIREQAEYLVSSYLQRVQAATITDSIENYSRNMWAQADYDRFLDRWSAVFGEHAIVARVFDRTSLVGGDVVDDFVAILGLDGRDAHHMADQQSNPSLSYGLYLLKLYVNRSLSVKESVEVGLFNYFDALARRVGKIGSPFPVDADFIEEVRTRFAPSNQRVADRWFDGRAPLFAVKTIAGAAKVSDDEVSAIAANLGVTRGVAYRAVRRVLAAPCPAGTSEAEQQLVARLCDAIPD